MAVLKITKSANHAITKWSLANLANFRNNKGLS